MEKLMPEDDFVTLRRGFLNRVDLRLQCMNSLYEEWMDSLSSRESSSLRDLYYEAHKLAGAASCYQVHDLTIVAQELERLIYSISQGLLLAPEKASKAVEVRRQLDSIASVYSDYQRQGLN